MDFSSDSRHHSAVWIGSPQTSFVLSWKRATCSRVAYSKVSYKKVVDVESEHVLGPFFVLANCLAQLAESIVHESEVVFAGCRSWTGA